MRTLDLYSETRAPHKPGSVLRDHLSKDELALVLKRPYPEVSGQPQPSLLGLAPDGVCLARGSPRGWWALIPPFHPYLLSKKAVCLCGTLLDLRPLDVIQRPALWSPDFPLLGKERSHRILSLQNYISSKVNFPGRIEQAGSKSVAQGRKNKRHEGRKALSSPPGV